MLSPLIAGTTADLAEEGFAQASPARMYRIADGEAEIGGVGVPAGAFLSLSLLSANHDERMFPDADRFDLLLDEFAARR
ncbi:MAG TPA: hypothetical protein VGP26_26540 [Actinophytocola sp.]|jgi:cytochrome P450|nr:hypothetical protein [Actinophytocola sp.]